MAVLAVAAASTIVMALACVQDSLTGSVSRYEDSVAGSAALEVTGLTDTGVDVGLLPSIKAIRGVAAVTPLIVHQVVVNDVPTDIIGIDISSLGHVQASQTNLMYAVAAAPKDHLTPGSVLATPTLESELHIHKGSVVTVYSGDAVHRVAIAGELTGPTAADVGGGSYLGAALPLAQQLADMPGRVDTFLVSAVPHTSIRTLQERLVRLAGTRADVESPSQLAHTGTAVITSITSLLPVIAFAVSLVALFLVFNTMSMLVLDRRKELATLRALGASRRSLLAGVVVQACILGVIGGGIGIVTGVLAGRWLVDGLPAFLTSALPTTTGFEAPLSAFLEAGGIALLGSAAAAWFPARRASRVPPIEAMRPHDFFGHVEDRLVPRPLLATLALAAMAAGSLIVWVNPISLAALGFGLLVFGLGVLAVAASPAILEVARRVASFPRKTASTLAAASLQQSPRRAVGTILAVATAISMVVGIGEIAGDGVSTVNKTFGSLGRPTFWVSTAPSTSLPNHLLLPETLRLRLDKLPGVAAVRAGQIAYATFDNEEIMLQGLQRGSDAPMYANAPESAQLALAKGQGFIISSQIAQNHHIAVGRDLTIETPLGSRTLPVVAIVVTFIWPSGTVALSLNHLRTWYRRPGASWYELNVRPGADPQRTFRPLMQLARSSRYPVFVSTGPQYLAGAKSAISNILGVLYGLEIIALGVATMTVLNTLVISVIERRRELGVLRALGANRAELPRIVTIEAVAIALVGAACGIPLGILLQALGIRGDNGAEGLPITFQFLAAPIFVAVMGVLAISFLGAWWPARQAARLNVLEAIGYE